MLDPEYSVDTKLRIEALDFAMRYPPPSADVAVQDATAYLGFLQANQSGSASTRLGE